MVEVKIKSMIRAYRLAVLKKQRQKKKTSKKNRIPFMDEMDEIFGDTLPGQPTTSSEKLTIHRVRPSSTMLLSSQDDGDTSPDEEDDADGGGDDKKSYPTLKPEHFDPLDSKEAGRNARFERKLKFIEELEKKREKIKERRFQELLKAIRQSRK